MTSVENHIKHFLQLIVNPHVRAETKQNVIEPHDMLICAFGYVEGSSKDFHIKSTLEYFMF